MPEKTVPSWSDWLPQKDQLTQHPWLKRWAKHLISPELWRLQHESVARGAAVGLMWAFLIPVAQILVAVVHCVWWRAHIPTAAAMTMVTNPFTIGFWLWLAYQPGSRILGTDTASPTTWNQPSWDMLLSYGGPIILGMGLFALGASTLGYVLVHGIWRLRVVFKQQSR